MLFRWRKAFLEHVPQTLSREKHIARDGLWGWVDIYKELEIAKGVSPCWLAIAKRKQDLAMMLRKGSYPVTSVYDVPELLRSSCYHKLAEKDRGILRTAIEGIVGPFSIYGSRRITAQPRRASYGMIVNRKGWSG